MHVTKILLCLHQVVTGKEVREQQILSKHNKPKSNSPLVWAVIGRHASLLWRTHRFIPKFVCRFWSVGSSALVHPSLNCSTVKANYLPLIPPLWILQEILCLILSETGQELCTAQILATQLLWTFPSVVFLVPCMYFTRK